MSYQRRCIVFSVTLFLIAVLYDRVLQTTLHGLSISTHLETMVTWFGSGVAALLVIFCLLAFKGAPSGLLAVRSFVISSSLVTVIKHLVGRARPYASISPLTIVGPSIVGKYTSFPSGHSATAFAMAVIIGWNYPKARVTAYVLAILVALSRVALGVHWPSDIVAGSVIGVLVSLYCIETSKPDLR